MAAEHQPHDFPTPELEGCLFKQSKWIKKWRLRHFVLQDNKLFFSTSQSDLYHGHIDLNKCTSVKSAPLQCHHPQNMYVFIIETFEDRFYLAADSEKTRNLWIDAIRKSVVRQLTLMRIQE